MVENKDTYCNPKHVQDAFVFCPILKYIEIDNFMAQGFVQKNCPKWKKQSISFLYKFSNITFEEKDSLKSKMQATEDIPNNMEINATKNISILLSMQQSSSVLKKTLQYIIGYSIVLIILVGSIISLSSDWVRIF